MKPFIAAVLFVMSCNALGQQDNQTPLAKYKSQTHYGVFICAIKFKTAQLVAQMGQEPDTNSDWRGCINEHQAVLKTSYSAALKTIKRKPAVEALKAVQVAAIGALTGIAPDLDERVLTYNQRQSALKARLADAWTRFDLEAESP